MKNLILEVEEILLNLFQVGISSIYNNFEENILEISNKCNKYNLILLSKELNELYILIKENNENKIDITKKIMYLINHINIIKQKISYDEIGGY